MGKIWKWDAWWRHTLNPIIYQAYKWSYLSQFAVQSIETWQADSSTGNTPTAITKFYFHANSLFSSPHPLDFNMLVIFSLKNVKQSRKLELTYLYACCLLDHAIWGAVNKISKWNSKRGQNIAFNPGMSGTQFVAMVTELLELVWKNTFSRILLQSIKHFWYKLTEISLFIIFEQNLVECMTSSLGWFAYFKNLNISRAKRDISKQ